MKYAREFLVSTVVGGLFVVVPVYLAVLLMALLSLSLFAVITLIEWLVMKRRFSYLAAESES